MAMPAPSGRFLHVNGAKLHYIQEGSGPDLVLVHGASGSVLDWSFDAIPKLKDRYRITAFDRPGLGHSDPIASMSNLRGQSRHLLAAMDQLDLRQPRIMGHSFGGAVALGMGVEAPETIAGMVLLSAPSHVWPGGLAWHYTLATTPVIGPIAVRILLALAGKRLAMQTLEVIFHPDPVPEGYADHMEIEHALRPSAVTANAHQVIALKEHLRALTPLYPSLAMPIEIVHGDADRTVPMSIHSTPLAQALPNAHFTELSGAGHMPHHTHWAEVERALARLERVLGDQASSTSTKVV